MQINLIVKDDGVGLPEDLDWRNTDSLGLELISLIGEQQLGGKIKYNGKNGAEFSIIFERQ